MAKRSAQGTGSIRKKTVNRKGKEYTYWEARYTEGFDSGTGKQIQRSITGKTQKDVTQRLKAATAAQDAGTYIAPSKMTVGDWLDIWAKDYLGGVKESTQASYKGQIKNHIKPALGSIKLEALDAHTIQRFYNKLKKVNYADEKLAGKTQNNVHGVLHKALKQAVMNGYIRFNPTDSCIRARIERKELKPLDEEQTKSFLSAIKGHRYETLFTFAIFTGLREGEVLGLQWNCVNLEQGIILVEKQLQREKKKNGELVILQFIQFIKTLRRL